MSSAANFIQIHFLTAYGANVLNRDDLNRPKSMVFGSAPRLRVSSQCIKRAWRLSDTLAEMERGIRTREFWLRLGQAAVAAGHSEAAVIDHILPLRVAMEGAKTANAKAEDEAVEPAAEAEVEAKSSAKKGTKKATKKKALKSLDELSGNLVYFSKAEADALTAALMASLGEPGSDKQPLTAAQAEEVLAANLPMSADVAMFGRMVAEVRKLNVEGAVQVAHVFTVNKAIIDDDYFTAVDDLGSDAGGSGHVSANAFGSGLYYGFVNIDVRTLVKNLKGDMDKARKLVGLLVEAIATVSPAAKQNTFAARSYASYVSVEATDAQPRSYADAFLKPVQGDDLRGVAIERLQAERQSLSRAFPGQRFSCVELDRVNGVGSLPEVQAAAVQALG